MRTRASMGKMVNKLTKRELAESFAMIERIARGVSQPYTREFKPHLVSINDNVVEDMPAQRESAFIMAEQNADNVVVMRSNAGAIQTPAKAKIVFPDVFYEYFDIVETAPSKVG